MTTDSHSIWSARDLILTFAVCIFAVFWVTKKKSRREKIALVFAAIILAVVNSLIIYSANPGENWRNWLPLVDIFLSAATYITVMFNRMAKTSADRNPQKQQK